MKVPDIASLIRATLACSAVIARSDSDEAIHLAPRWDGLVRFARNDGGV